MSQPQEPGDRPEPSVSTSTDGAGSPTWFWLVPALTFIAGLALGAVVTATNSEPETGDSAGPAAVPTATAAPTTPASAGTPSDRTITVPASCEEGLDRSRAALSTVGDAVDALRALDTARLQELLDQLQQARQEVDRLAEQCRREAADQN